VNAKKRKHLISLISPIQSIGLPAKNLSILFDNPRRLCRFIDVFAFHNTLLLFSQTVSPLDPDLLEDTA
jgi:hypothetical protein